MQEVLPRLVLDAFEYPIKMQVEPTAKHFFVRNDQGGLSPFVRFPPLYNSSIKSC